MAGTMPNRISELRFHATSAKELQTWSLVASKIKIKIHNNNTESHLNSSFHGLFQFLPWDNSFRREDRIVFEDHFPAMMEKLGAEGFMNELCKGFRVLMDYEKELITLESLKKNSALLGLDADDDQQLRSMLTQGDFDGDGCLNQMEFCVLMLRLSPTLMNRPTDLLLRDFPFI